MKSGGEALIKALVKSALFVKEKKLKAFVDNDSIMAQHKLALWELVEGSTVAKAMHLDELVRAFNLQAYEAAHEYRDAVASQRSPEPMRAYGIDLDVASVWPSSYTAIKAFIESYAKRVVCKQRQPIGPQSRGCLRCRSRRRQLDSFHYPRLRCRLCLRPSRFRRRRRRGCVLRTSTRSTSSDAKLRLLRRRPKLPSAAA